MESECDSPSHERFAELSALRTSETEADESWTRPTPNVSCEIPEKTPGNGTGKPTRARPNKQTHAARPQGGAPQQHKQRRRDHEGPSTEHHKHTHAPAQAHTQTAGDTRKTPARETGESPKTRNQTLRKRLKRTMMRPSRTNLHRPAHPHARRADRRCHTRVSWARRCLRTCSS